MIYECIYELNKSKSYPVHRIINLLGLNESNYYYWKQKGQVFENNSIRLMHKIINIYKSSSGVYGSGKITIILNKKNFNVSKSTVSRLMRLMGIRSIVYKHFKPHISHKLTKNDKDIVNLVKGIKITKINEVWTTDISYIQTIDDGNLYFISFIDQCSKKVVAWDLRKSQTTFDILTVLKKAIIKNKPKPGLIIHSDKGSQMRSFEYKNFLTSYGFIRSYTSIDHSCDENAAHESFHSLLKRERLYLKKLKNYNDAYREIFDYIENFYNPKRIHTSIGNMSPIEYEKQQNSN